MANHPQKNTTTKLSLEELEKLYENDHYIPYHELLRVHQWATKRMEILDRDTFYCQKCHGFQSSSDKNGTLFWSNVEAIIWSDSAGQARISSLVQPSSPPDKLYQMHVHHKKYIKNRLPWQYDNDDLITLCNHCHKDEHEKNIIPVFDEFNRQIVVSEPCDRCNGEGIFPEYSHVEGGICFKCRGLRINVVLIDKKL